MKIFGFTKDFDMVVFVHRSQKDPRVVRVDLGRGLGIEDSFLVRKNETVFEPVKGVRQVLKTELELFPPGKNYPPSNHPCWDTIRSILK